MARVTVEDCVEIIPNRFELVVLATQRARAISSGAQITVDRDNDKNPVIALREIANGNISPDILRENTVVALQKRTRVEKSESDDDSFDMNSADAASTRAQITEEIDDFESDEELGDMMDIDDGMFSGEDIDSED